MIFVSTKNHHSFIVDEVHDELRDKMGMVYGRAVHLYARLVKTKSNPKGTWTYSDYCDVIPSQVCKRTDSVELRNATQQEEEFFQKIQNSQPLSGEDKDWLKQNFAE